MTRYLGDDLILVLSPPRSGSTMLQRILGSHSDVQTHPEPHILTPLAFQGVFKQVERADYNHRVAAVALREFVEFLPGGEEDYLDACRAYCEVLYRQARARNGKRYFVDKTPNYADAALDFVTRCLPNAHYVVLMRHPIAQVASHANTFVRGDFHRSQYQRDIPGTFIQPLAWLMREAPVRKSLVRYEDLVTKPEATVRELLAFLDLPWEPECLRFGDKPHITRSVGDPKIGRFASPVTDSLSQWAADLVNRPDRERLCRNAIARVSEHDLQVLGYPAKDFWLPLEQLRQERLPHRSALPVALWLAERKWNFLEWFGGFTARTGWLSSLKRLRRLLDRVISYSGRWTSPQ